MYIFPRARKASWYVQPRRVQAELYSGTMDGATAEQNPVIITRGKILLRAMLAPQSRASMPLRVDWDE